MATLEDSDTLAATPSGGGEPIGTERGARIGRFVVIDVLGAGGMGVVVAAHDPTLDRKVAVKVLRPGLGGPAARERMLREARAMARLSDPGVLTVHEAGVVDDQVFIAMELATGGTLRAWHDGVAHPWREVLRRYLAAARGLAAAHGAGLIHRDFKPDNVLLTGDGTVRVADFGLAGGSAPVDPDDAAGLVVGTPAYMAPEQHAGEGVGPAADQFAFCVSLWEGLYGARPYRADTLTRLVDDVSHARRLEPPVDRAVPAWLRAVIERGLAPAPAERWPSMAALIAALEADPEAPRRRRLVRAGIVVAAVATVAATVMIARRPGATPGDRCRDPGPRLAQVWSPARRDALTAALADPTVAAPVIARLEDRAAGWARARIDTCEATHVRGEQSDELLDRRIYCLDRRLDQLDDAITLLSTGAGPMPAGNALAVVEALVPVAVCDADAVGARGTESAPSAEIRARVGAIERDINELSLLEAAGRHHEAKVRALQLVADARAAGWAPLLPGALIQLAHAHDVDGELAATEALLHEATLAAAEAHDDEHAAEAWIGLVVLYASRERDLDKAAEARRAAEGALIRAGRPRLMQAAFLRASGLLELELGDAPAALRVLDAALAGYTEVLGPEAAELGSIHATIADVHYLTGDLDAARAAGLRALALFEGAYGGHHPSLATMCTTLSVIDHARGDFEAARDEAERGLAITDRVLGADSASAASLHGALANSLVGLGRLDDAIVHAERAVALTERHQGADHPALAAAYNLLGNALLVRRDLTPARAALAHALAIDERLLGPDHPDLAYDLSALAAVDLALGDAAAALAAAERGLALRTATAQDPLLVTESELGVAMARWATGGDRRAARAAVIRARARFVDAGDAGAPYLPDIDAWLTAHPR